MKLVFALVVLVNNLPSNTDDMYFATAQSCNQIAYVTEKGVAGDNQSWSTQGVNIKAYCVPRLVPKNATTFENKK